MQLELHPEGKDVIEFEAPGSLFYLILEGSVEVWVPEEGMLQTLHEVNQEINKVQ